VLLRVSDRRELGVDARDAALRLPGRERPVQRRAIGEAAKQRGAADPRRLRDVLQRRAPQAELQQLGAGGVEDALGVDVERRVGATEKRCEVVSWSPRDGSSISVSQALQYRP
jgi:hypothetical protein